MIIKAKYPTPERPYMYDRFQGFGSLYGGNHSSNVIQIEDERLLEFENEGGIIGLERQFSLAFSNDFNSTNYIK